MIISGHDTGKAIGAEICIVGGGPAAISVALELLKTDATIIMLVGGGERSESPLDRDLNRGIVERPGSHEPLEENRRRVFGGASSVWGGRCIPFGPMDFKHRPWIPNSGWPISYEDLEPFYRQAIDVCRAGAFVFDSRVVFQNGDEEIIEGMDNEDLQSWHLERWSPPINFAEEYRSQLSGSKKLRVYVDAHAVEIVESPAGGQVEIVRAVSKGVRFDVSARVFVIATGGIENARLLLASKSRFHPNGLGNTNDLVGRFYMLHPHGTFAEVAPKTLKQMPFEYQRDGQGVYCRRRWAISEEAQSRLEIGNAIFFLDHIRRAQGHRDAVFSAVFVAKTVIGVFRSRGISEKAKRIRASALPLKQHLKTLFTDGFRALPRLLSLARARFVKDRRLPSLLPSFDSARLGLYFQAEQVPNWASRITLSSDQVDAHGMPRAQVELQFDSLDIKTVAEAHRIFVSRYRAAGAGEIECDEQKLMAYLQEQSVSFNSAAHHLGTTRMSKSQEQGVVDENCRVHGMRNLYVSGSSVFSTGSHANPTLTLVAVALRLGRHLAENISDWRSDATGSSVQNYEQC